MNSNSPSSILHTKTRCRFVHARGFTVGQKTMENQDWATGPPGRWAVVGRGPVFSKTLWTGRVNSANVMQMNVQTE